MAQCKDCIHDKVCCEWAVGIGMPFVNADTCEHYTADVVPKSEVAREIFEEIEKCRYDWTDCLNMRKFAELKKKYTESEDKV